MDRTIEKFYLRRERLREKERREKIPRWYKKYIPWGKFIVYLTAVTSIVLAIYFMIHFSK